MRQIVALQWITLSREVWYCHTSVERIVRRSVVWNGCSMLFDWIEVTHRTPSTAELPICLHVLLTRTSIPQDIGASVDKSAPLRYGSTW